MLSDRNIFAQTETILKAYKNRMQITLIIKGSVSKLHICGVDAEDVTRPQREQLESIGWKINNDKFVFTL